MKITRRTPSHMVSGKPGFENYAVFEDDRIRTSFTCRTAEDDDYMLEDG
jgi:hypothetical protein